MYSSFVFARTTFRAKSDCNSFLVMPGLVPGIHVLATTKKDVDGRDKPGHDGLSMSQQPTQYAITPRASASRRGRFFSRRTPLPFPACGRNGHRMEAARR